MTRNSQPKPAPRRWSRRRIFALVGVVLGGTAAFVALGIASGPHAWRPLGGDHGRIRWAETRTDFAVEPPLAPEWIRNLRKRGIPWPTDQPLEPPGASFAADGAEHTVAWYVVQSSRATNELWHVQKDSVRITDAEGQEVYWPGGTGAVLIDPDRNLQYLYLGVPQQLSGTEARISFRLSRFDGPTTPEIVLPF